mmetsp:Transcript_22649/g.40061  ORF Transcript_22649/g.40061 Transcript_22649/m.40061 type:complete len:209 (-) Transcript_22649:77-703(-)|eukprot:CAMPEP_0197523692 /NCGR_PEP_ID=MMETSP1318-20131121/8569_1 /TAXON_ID=552666 /ORGANISM="Partenskyella glossopodia, Strain RCC365" /LENGTH=208 /DNA_ID=CAMNT_0043076461 /DNA_START=160 /DNA_END=786 /DNA_ORIENTATION=-
MTGTEWFYMDIMGVRQGPVTLSRLKALCEKEEVSIGTYVWGTGQGEWKRLWEMPDIREYVAGPRGPLTFDSVKKQKEAKQFSLPNNETCDKVFKSLRLDGKAIQEKIASLIKIFDRDDSGTIELSEINECLETFTQYLSKAAKRPVLMPANTEVRRLLQLLDKNGNGRLDLVEIQHLAKGLGALYFIETEPSLIFLKQNLTVMTWGDN